MFFYGKKFRFSKITKGSFRLNLSTIYQQVQPERVKWGQNGGLGAFFSKSYIYLYYYTFVYTYKNNPPFPQKSPEALKALTFLWGIFLKIPRKKPPKSPHRGQKSPTGQKNTPQGWLNLTGLGWSSFRPIFYYGGYICAFNQGGLKSDRRCSVREL